MTSFRGAPALAVAALLVAALGMASCGDGERKDRGPLATGGLAGATADAAGEGAEAGGASGEASSAGSGAAGGPEADCRDDGDCTPLGECYSAACSAGVCVGAPLARGSACSGGYCNGFGRCLPCLDDAPAAEKDQGCSSKRPVCVETGLEPGCVACASSSDCDDGNECTADRCSDQECESTPRPFGSSCSIGLCDGDADEPSCAPCFDDATGGPDTGCTPELPSCDTSQTPPACTACRTAADCDDGKACTTDSCERGSCEHTTLASGTPCPFGYCNGIPGQEICVHKPCQSDAHCDDHVACTREVCEDNACTFTADDGECPDSGDVCKPNVCTVANGCQPIDKTRRYELLKNGYLDAGNVDWLEESESYPQVIYEYDYVPTLLPHSAVYVAWLGGGESALDDHNSLSQSMNVPEGTLELDLGFFYQVWTDDLPDSRNRMEIYLYEAGGEPGEPLAVLRNDAATTIWKAWSTTIPATGWAGKDVTLEFRGTAVDGFSHFFVDTISLNARVCR